MVGDTHWFECRVDSIPELGVRWQYLATLTTTQLEASMREILAGYSGRPSAEIRVQICPAPIEPSRGT